VLNTRPREQAPELSRRLRLAGFEPVEAPAIEIVPAWDAGRLVRILGQLRSGRYAWVVLPSQNAGRILLEGLMALGGSPSELRHSRVLCGTATAEALGLRADRTLARFSAAAALEAIRPEVSAGEHVLVPGAAEGREELVEGLRLIGVHVDAPVCYRTRPVAARELVQAAELLTAGRVQAVCLTSPLAVQGLLEGLGPAAAELLARPAIVCIGQTTADAAKTLGLRVDTIALETSVDSLVQAVQDTLAARGVAA
jgi:uroporphyrinogen-III synthase